MFFTCAKKWDVYRVQIAEPECGDCKLAAEMCRGAAKAYGEDDLRLSGLTAADTTSCNAISVHTSRVGDCCCHYWATTETL